MKNSITYCLNGALILVFEENVVDHAFVAVVAAAVDVAEYASVVAVGVVSVGVAFGVVVDEIAAFDADEEDFRHFHAEV